MQPVGVVRHVHLALAHEFPVVAVDRSVEHVELVGGAQPVGGRPGVVVGDVRGAPYPALAGVVGPGVAGLPELVHGLVHQHDVARQPRRRERFLLEQDHRVAEFFQRHARQRVAQLDFQALLDQRVVAAAGDRGLADDARHRLAPIPQQVVPDHLQAVVRDREGDADHRVAHSVAVVHELRGGGGVAGGVVDPLRGGGAAPGGIGPAC